MKLIVDDEFRLAGERIALRQARPADADGSYLDWMLDPEVVRYTEARYVEHTRDSLREFIEAMRASESSLFLAIEDGDGRHVGNIKLGPVVEMHRRASIGIILGDKGAWGKGYGTEAVALVRDYAFGTLGLHKLTAGSMGDNAGSVRIFEKAGFVVEGLRREHHYFDGAWHDVVYLGAFKADWEAGR